jgi:hypothetical protein
MNCEWFWQVTWALTLFRHKLYHLFSALHPPSLPSINPILHTAWLNNHALTLKRNTAKYYFGEKSSFLHTFLKISCESRKILVKLKDFLVF